MNNILGVFRQTLLHLQHLMQMRTFFFALKMIKEEQLALRGSGVHATAQILVKVQ